MRDVFAPRQLRRRRPPGTRHFAVLLAAGGLACAAIGCDGGDRSPEEAAGTPAKEAERTSVRAVVVMSNVGPWEPMSRGISVLHERGIFSHGSTGIGWEVLVGEPDAEAARAILEADEQCRTYVRR